MELDELTLKNLLESVAAKSPTPGGGAVAAITGALAAALAHMVLNYSVGKKSLAAHQNLHLESVQQFQSLRADLLALSDADAKAYAAMNDLWKLDPSDERRQRDLPGAVEAAIDPPVQMLAKSVAMLRNLHELCGKTNAHLNSDLAIAAILAEAAARAAAWNVAINLPLLSDEQGKDQIRLSMTASIADAKSLVEHIEAACRLHQ